MVSLSTLLAPVKLPLADFLARRALASPVLERALVAGCRRPSARNHLALGAVAVAYPRVLLKPELRVAELGTYKFYVNVAEHLGVAPFFFGDTFTAWLTPELVGPGDACVDIGANVGHYTFRTASLVGPRGRVIAFEANPTYAALVRRSIEINGFGGFVAVDSRAVWHTTGQHMQFNLSTNPSNSGTSSLLDLGAEYYQAPGHSIEVETVTLTDALREQGVERVALVKIDVERAEQGVLEGARELLAEHRIDALLVEMNANSPSQILLEEHGYKGYLVDLIGNTLTDAATLCDGDVGDFLWLSPERRTALGPSLQRWLR